MARPKTVRASAQGFILFVGKSELSQGNIVVIATGFQKPSKNGKTGPMIQIWILNADVSPTEAIKTGEDEVVCGDCPLRGDVCYVELGRAPYQVWNTYQRGGYPMLTDYKVFANQSVRFGAYGDPAAAPIELWDKVAAACDYDITGYSHQWRRSHPDLKKYCMASVEDPLQRFAAKSLGWRTFRVREDDEPVIKGEAVCPASEEAGHLIQCIDCMACHGTHAGRRSDIVIAVHGTKHAVAQYAQMKTAPAPLSHHLS